MLGDRPSLPLRENFSAQLLAPTFPILLLIVPFVAALLAPPPTTPDEQLVVRQGTEILGFEDA